jgi:SAM-dependent methyltransferase
MTVLGILKRILNKKGYTIAPKGLGYFAPAELVKKAREQNQGLCEYLESNNVGGVGRRRDFIVGQLRERLPARLEGVVEVGAGTGMYLEKIIENHKPSTYQVYETNLEWVKYLNETYSGRTDLKCRNADGASLRDTPSGSVDAAFSHGVFVYTSLLTSYSYLQEMARVVKPGGWVVFDCFLTENFGLKIIKQWQEDSYHWTFPVALSGQLIKEYAASHGLTQVGTFDVPYHASFSTYFIFQKLAA